MYHLERNGHKVRHITEGKFKFENWANGIYDEKMLQKRITFNDAVAQIEEIDYKSNDSIWGLRVFKLRNTNIPAKVSEDHNAKPVDLDPEEYIGEDLFMIYDENTGVAMIQQNRLAFGISRLEEFFTNTYRKYADKDYEGRIEIQPIADLDRMSKIGKGKFRQIEISFANLDRFDSKGGSLYSIMHLINRMSGKTGVIKIGVGNTRSKDATLNETTVRQIASELTEESTKRFIRSAKVRLKEEEDSDVEIVDLFEENCHDYIELNIRERDLLNYDETTSKMIQYYNKRKNELISYI